jgi:hypothetical protein
MLAGKLSEALVLCLILNLRLADRVSSVALLTPRTLTNIGDWPYRWPPRLIKWAIAAPNRSVLASSPVSQSKIAD